MTRPLSPHTVVLRSFVEDLEAERLRRLGPLAMLFAQTKGTTDA